MKQSGKCFVPFSRQGEGPASVWGWWLRHWWWSRLLSRPGSKNPDIKSCLIRNTWSVAQQRWELRCGQTCYWPSCPFLWVPGLSWWHLLRLLNVNKNNFEWLGRVLAYCFKNHLNKQLSNETTFPNCTVFYVNHTKVNNCKKSLRFKDFDPINRISFWETFNTQLLSKVIIFRLQNQYINLKYTQFNFSFRKIISFLMEN